MAWFAHEYFWPAGGWFEGDYFDGPDAAAVADVGSAYIKITVGKVSQDIKMVRDRGTGTTSASGPVTVTFNKAYADINTLDAFPIDNSSRKLYRVINFVDAPNPTSFTLEFYNDSGTRLALDFGWTAEGVLQYAG